MEKKNTDNLQQELMNAPDLNQFLSQNQKQFVNPNVAELLNRLFERKNISKASLAKQAKTDILTLYRSACLKQVRTIFLDREKISLEPILNLMCEWGEKNMDERFELTNPQCMQ